MPFRSALTCCPARRVNDLESINKAQQARLEALKTKPPEVDISDSEYEYKAIYMTGGLCHPVS